MITLGRFPRGVLQPRFTNQGAILLNQLWLSRITDRSGDFPTRFSMIKLGRCPRGFLQPRFTNQGVILLNQLWLSRIADRSVDLWMSKQG